MKTTIFMLSIAMTLAVAAAVAAPVIAITRAVTALDLEAAVND